MFELWVALCLQCSGNEASFYDGANQCLADEVSATNLRVQTSLLYETETKPLQCLRKGHTEQNNASGVESNE